MKIVLYILLAVVILLLMVVIHEFGHYIAGKILKFKINEFSVGFGPKIFQKKKKNGEVFSLRLIPLGGYCAFEGEDSVEDEAKEKTPVQPVFEELSGAETVPEAEKTTDSDVSGESVSDDTEVLETVEPVSETAEPVPEKRSFIKEKPWKRIIVLLAGATFNLLSAIIFSFIYILAVGYSVPTVSYVYADENGVSYNQQINVGDTIVGVNGKNIGVMNTYSELTSKAKGDEVVFTVRRNGETVKVTVSRKQIVANEVEEKDGVFVEKTDEKGEPIKTEYTGFGIVMKYSYVNGRADDAFLYSVPFTFKLSWSILGTFGGLFTGSVPITSLTGPVGTIGVIADLSMQSWRYILMLLPLIASNLAIFNLLPIPALDGSKVIFTTIEWIRGKPVNRKVENIIHTVGLILLFAFVIIIDIVGMFLR